ncbi:hypothetical protein [Yoonia sp. 2307UL14-13]|uniref:hypothetical protein n=1 Tax=Yoonia sp. 2307UL14-13 TaxID=3126506 RepID=UPI0030AECEDB
MSQSFEEPRASTINVSSLNVAMFSNDHDVSVFYASTAKILESLDAAGELASEPAYDFLIFFAGYNLFIDDQLRPEFADYVGGSIRAKIDNHNEPTIACKTIPMEFLDGTRGLVAYLRSDQSETIVGEKCILTTFAQAWSGEAPSQADKALGATFVDLLQLLQNR